MKNKKKLLIWSDSPEVPSGFGIVASHLFKNLHKKFDVDILGINHNGLSKYDTSKYFMYPASTNPQEPFGFQSMPTVLAESKPDIIFLMQDIFQIQRAMIVIKKFAPDAKVVIYFPVDSAPFNLAWKSPLEEADEIITYTQFAKDTIIKAFPDMSKKTIHMLDHGIDTDIFKPLDEKDIKSDRKAVKWNKKFVICNVNRFQPRKNIAATLRATALFTKGYKVCKCGNWYLKTLESCDLNGCGKDKVIDTVDGKKDALLYLHMQPDDVAMGHGLSMSLQAHALNCGYTDKNLNSNLIMNRTNIYDNPLPVEEVNKIYNMSCVNLSTTIGEGFGFSLAEAQATGTPTIAPRNSAIPEVVADSDHLINNIAHFTLPNDSSNVRRLVDIKGVIKALDIEYSRWLDNNKEPVKSQKVADDAKLKFNWDDKRKVIEYILGKACI